MACHQFISNLKEHTTCIIEVVASKYHIPGDTNSLYSQISEPLSEKQFDNLKYEAQLAWLVQ
jgi:hypothetical protein